MYGEGISREGEIIDLGSDVDIIQKSGSWYSYNGERLGQGRENSKQYLKENTEIRQEIMMKIREHHDMDIDRNAPPVPKAEEEVSLLEE